MSKYILSAQLPVLLALMCLLIGGVLLLSRADAQARDTIRKHHLFDLETALFAARARTGNVPPAGQAAWCGGLDDPLSATVRAEIEAALRQQNEKYANPAKPFPTDPRAGRSSSVALPVGYSFSAAWAKADQPYSYFYWKRSPAAFDLYAQIESGNEGNFNTSACGAPTPFTYTYGLVSALREDYPRWQL